MTPEYILRKSLCRPAHCSNQSIEQRARQVEYINFADGYAEPGYTDPDKAVLFADWNYFPNAVTELLERYGYSIEWEDEWTTCSGCNKALRTSPNSYGWQPSYIDGDGEILCLDCADIPTYLESLEDNPKRALNHQKINPADYGYCKIEGDFENGFHPGQNDNPAEIYNRLAQAGHKRILFFIDGVGQFDIGFSVWKKV